MKKNRFLSSAVCLLGFASAGLIGDAHSAVTSLLESRQRQVVMQEWDLSCGAAALTTLLRYQHGIDVTEKEVATELIGRQEYIDNPELLRIRQGFSLLDLKRYVDRIGYQGDGFGRLSFENLLDLAPAIVPVELDGYNHFVIFRGMRGNRIVVADPAWGNRVLQKDAFLAAWIEIGKLGHVAFTVTNPHGVVQVNNADSLSATSSRSPLVDQPSLSSLAPTELDFVMLK